MSTMAERARALEEVDACLYHAHHGLEALLVLLAGHPGPLPLDARGLHALLAPLADDVAQAAQAVQLLQPRAADAAAAQTGPPRPPAPVSALALACGHDAQGLGR